MINSWKFWAKGNIDKLPYGPHKSLADEIELLKKMMAEGTQ